jgi:hypothetical protein
MESIDVLPPEKIAFIAYNIGVYESVQIWRINNKWKNN